MKIKVRLYKRTHATFTARSKAKQLNLIKKIRIYKKRVEGTYNYFDGIFVIYVIKGNSF